MGTITYDQAYADKMEMNKGDKLESDLSTRRPMLDRSSFESRRERASQSSDSTASEQSTSAGNPAPSTPMDQGDYSTWGKRS